LTGYQVHKEHDRCCRVDGVRADGVGQLVEDGREAEAEGHEDEDMLKIVTADPRMRTAVT
jgi:hypothetical protein